MIQTLGRSIFSQRFGVGEKFNQGKTIPAFYSLFCRYSSHDAERDLGCPRKFHVASIQIRGSPTHSKLPYSSQSLYRTNTSNMMDKGLNLNVIYVVCIRQSGTIQLIISRLYATYKEAKIKQYGSYDHLHVS